MRPIIRLATLLALGALPACLHRRPPDDEAVAAAVESSALPATLVIDNSSIWDVRIFAVRSTQNVRLGVVTSGQTATFALPPQLITRDLVVLADPIGARSRLRTDAFVARPGDEVKITLEKRLRSYGLSIH